MYVKVWVQPGARKEKVLANTDGTFELSVREPAERNMANTRVRTILATHYGVSLGAVRIISGHRSGSKIFDVALPE